MITPMATNDYVDVASQFDVIVIGAGWSGLAAAKTLLQVEPDISLAIVDEEASIGGTWCKDRVYPYMTVESGRPGLFEFSDHPMDEACLSKDGFIDGPSVHGYLDSYAEKFNLKTRTQFETRVKCVEETQGKQKWLLTTIHVANPEKSRQLSCSKLVVATGLTSRANMPDTPNNGFTGPVLHSRDLGKQTALDDLASESIERVTVYGGCKSAFDAVYYLLRAGKTIDWVIRNGGGGPAFMSPARSGPLWAGDLAMMRFLGMWSPNVFSRGSRWDALIHGQKRLPLADALVRGFWRASAWSAYRENAYSSSSNGKKLQPDLGLDAMLWCPTSVGVTTNPDMWADIHQGDRIRVHRASIKSIAAGLVELDDGTKVSSHALVFATGFRDSNDIFPNTSRAKLGMPGEMEESERSKWQGLQDSMDAEVVRTMPLLADSPGKVRASCEEDYHLYRFIVPTSSKCQDRSIVFLGFLRGNALSITREAQALWATAYLFNRLSLPSQDHRESDASLVNAWIRRRYMVGRKIPFAVWDWAAYVDLLFSDLGINSHRKSNKLAEVFGIYKPREFYGVVDEWLAIQTGR